MDPSSIDEVLNKVKTDCFLATDGRIGSNNNVSRQFCDRIFDKLMCWPKTLAGTYARQPCSNEDIKSTKQGFATKFCTEDGIWHVPFNATNHYSDYTQCGSFFINGTLPLVSSSNEEHEIYLRWLPIIKNIAHFGYVLSIVSLVASLIIFIKLQRLHCARNKLHVHLFLSFVMRAVMSLLKDGLFVRGTALTHDTIYVDGQPQFEKENYSWICKTIISLQQYFIVSNYVFLLMEGAYLHNLMFFNLFNDNGVFIYYALGWIIPMLFVVPWIALKATQEDVYCWTQKINKYIALFIDVPVGVTVLINFVLFIIIVRVLFVKITSMYMQQRRLKYRKLLRATSILVPLFGIPYVISVTLSFYVHKSQILEVVWLLFDQSFIAFQGFFACMVYCLLNGEVQVELKRKFRSFNDGRNSERFKRSRTISHTQQVPLDNETYEMTLHAKDHHQRDINNVNF